MEPNAFVFTSILGICIKVIFENITIGQISLI